MAARKKDRASVTETSENSAAVIGQFGYLPVFSEE